MQSSPFKCSVFWVSLTVIVASLFIWNARQERHQRVALQKQQIQTQRAAALLFRSFHTDNYLTYSAISKTTVRMGDQKMESVARIVHAPRRLSISYQSGAHAGLSGGYNQQWMWRQVAASQPMIPYAEIELPTDEMAAGRFALMLENYEAHWIATEPIGGRESEVIQLSPLRPAPGATGPGRRLWIDGKTGLTLRQQSFNYMMMNVMESSLSDVNFEPQISPNTFVQPKEMLVAARRKPWMAHATISDRERVSKLAGLYPPEAKNLPAGFQFDSVGAHRCQVCASPCYAILSRYTDGLNTLTIFALKPNCALSDLETKTKNGAPQNREFGTGNMAMRDLPQGHLIAVADLPAPVLERVLDSTTLRAYAATR